MDIAARRRLAERQDIGIPGADVPHLYFGDLRVVQRRAPVRGALEHGQMTNGLGDLLNRLHRRGTGADDADPLAGKIDPFLGPAVCGRTGL